MEVRKKDPDEHLSEPIKPITFWIENTTPIELRNIIKDGVEWNITFEKAGFKNAIQVKVQPDTADWDAGDIRYNVLDGHHRQIHREAMVPFVNQGLVKYSGRMYSEWTYYK